MLGDLKKNIMEKKENVEEKIARVTTDSLGHPLGQLQPFISQDKHQEWNPNQAPPTNSAHANDKNKL
jgi:hypothetical protein